MNIKTYCYQQTPIREVYVKSKNLTLLVKDIREVVI